MAPADCIFQGAANWSSSAAIPCALISQRFFPGVQVIDHASWIQRGFLCKANLYKEIMTSDT